MKNAVFYHIAVPIELAASICRDAHNKLCTMYVVWRCDSVHFLPEMETETEKVLCFQMRSSSFRTALHCSLSASKYFYLLEVALAKYRAGELKWESVRIDDEEEDDDDMYLYEGDSRASFTSIFPQKY